jgi:pyruvate kinase
MLSAESASGAHPVEAVAMLDRIARQVEGALWTERRFGSLTDRDEAVPQLPLHAAVGRSIAQLSRELKVRGIVVLSRTGTTAQAVAAARPAAPVVVVAEDEGACRRANLLWGTVPVRVAADELRHPSELARCVAVELGMADPGQHILVVAGFKRRREETAPTITALSI